MSKTDTNDKVKPEDMTDDQLKNEFYSALKMGKDSNNCKYLNVLTEHMLAHKFLGRT